MALLPIATVTPIAAGITLFVWGLATWSFNPPVQHRLIELSPGHAGLVLSLNASAIYLGVGLSGIVGGAVLDSGGPLLLPEVAAALTCAALLLLGVAWGRVRERDREEVAVG
jgi:predicted MFS family arabinose efflux permease